MNFRQVVVKDIDFNEKKQLEILNQMTEMYPTLPDWKYDRSASLKTFRYNYKNQWFGAADAVALHCMLRILKPKNFIEVGSGYSSAVTLDTNEYYFENKIKISFIEPYPERLKMLLRTDDNIGLQVKELQDIPLNYFEKLEEGDILFIDSSHVSKVASDVNYLIFEVFPRLNKGVYIHFHDIFYPFEYPEAWITNNGFIWNELYLSFKNFFKVCCNINIKIFLIKSGRNQFLSLIAYRMHQAYGLKRNFNNVIK